MRGILRVIPSDASVKSHRSIVLLVPPARSFLEDIVGGRLDLIGDLRTILHKGQAHPCMAFQGRTRGNDLKPQNLFAEMLQLQALVRKTGFVETGANPPDSIRGTVVILSGDDPFLKELIGDLLELGDANSFDWPSPLEASPPVKTPLAFGRRKI